MDFMDALIKQFGWKPIFFAWHFLWSVWAIMSFHLVSWVHDKKIVERTWAWIKHLAAHVAMSIALGVVTYKSKKHHKKHGKK